MWTSTAASKTRPALPHLFIPKDGKNAFDKEPGQSVLAGYLACTVSLDTYFSYLLQKRRRYIGIRIMDREEAKVRTRIGLTVGQPTQYISFMVEGLEPATPRSSRA